MNGTVLHSFSVFRCKSKRNSLALAWICGLILGSLLSVSADTLLAPVMHAVVYDGMSISGLLTVILLPLFLSAYAVYFSQSVVLILLAFLKAFLFSYTAAAILITYSVSGWLLLFLLLFSDLLMLPILWSLWLCAASVPNDRVLRRIGICVIFALLISFVDYTVIVPFLASLI